MDNDEFDGDISLQTAAKRLGVHYQTAYRWVRSGVLPANRVDRSYRVAAADVEAIVAVRRERRPLEYTGRTRDWDRLREQLYSAMVAGDDTGARRVVEVVHLARVPILEQCEQLLTPNLERSGEEWVTGDLSGARVRVAAGVCERTLDWAVGRRNSPAGHLTALVVTPKGDDHRLPSLMAAAVLRDGGWAVRQVHGVAASEIAGLAALVRPEMVVISVTLADAAAATDELGADLQESLGIPVLVGGPGKSLRQMHDAAGAVSALRLESGGPEPALRAQGAAWPG